VKVLFGEIPVHSIAFGDLIGQFLKDINRIADAIDVAADKGRIPPCGASWK
jgi:hypothetical protein